MEMNLVLNTLRDSAGIPFYPVVFQALYVLTWALHFAFVGLAIGAMGLSLVGLGKQKSDPHWKMLTAHLIQTGKISVSILIVLGVAPLLFTQVIYDPNWYVVNSLSGLWVFIFIYALIAGYAIYYWYYYANKKGSAASPLLGWVSFAILLFCGVLMHMFANEAIQPEQWMAWYAPGGVVDTSGTNFNIHPIRLLFFVSLAVPVVGIFLLNYRDYLSGREDFSPGYREFAGELGKKLALIGLAVSAFLFLAWMFAEGMLLDPLALAVVLAVLGLLAMIVKDANSYAVTGLLVVAALLIGALREAIRYNLMVDLGYNVYDYKVNFEIPSTVMFFLTFVGIGFSACGFMLTLAWKAGRTRGVFDASGDRTVTRLANLSLGMLVLWLAVYMGWGMFILFKNAL